MLESMQQQPIVPEPQTHSSAAVSCKYHLCCCHYCVMALFCVYRLEYIIQFNLVFMFYVLFEHRFYIFIRFYDHQVEINTYLLTQSL